MNEVSVFSPLRFHLSSRSLSLSFKSSIWQVSPLFALPSHSYPQIPPPCLSHAHVGTNTMLHLTAPVRRQDLSDILAPINYHLIYLGFILCPEVYILEINLVKQQEIHLLSQVPCQPIKFQVTPHHLEFILCQVFPH